ncbi:MAG: redox-sensing transcriptional repressor Rex [Elusimicrobiota bacterium]|jgi:redox-sensing transcriptional repressor
MNTEAGNQLEQDAEGASAPEKSVERLALYRRLLGYARDDGKKTIFSHEIAAASCASPVQVRRDLMEVGTLGHPRHGYEVDVLLRQLDGYFGMPAGIPMALVGIGNLGRAILGYFSGGKDHISVNAAFDRDPGKTGRTINGVRCHAVSELPAVLAAAPVQVGIIAVPAAEAQAVADLLVAAGVRGLMNMAPARLRVPPKVFVEDIDIALAIEKVSFFSRLRVKS